MGTFLLKNEILHSSHNNTGFIILACVILGTHVSFLCGYNVAAAQLLTLVLRM